VGTGTGGDMNGMFDGSPFNQDISSWDVSNVKSMALMFARTPFNQDIGGWDVGSVTNIAAMFVDSSFNQDISGWDVSNVTDMDTVFAGSPFNQDIGNWDIGNVTDMTAMFNDSQMSTENYSRTLIGWANYVSDNNDSPANITLGASGVNYNDVEYAPTATYKTAVEARSYLTDNDPPNWTITDGGQD
jgi:surface protein